MWVFTCFRQKNIRTKEGIKNFNIHSNEFDVYSKSSMLAPAVFLRLTFVEYEQKRGCLLVFRQKNK